MIQVLLLPAIMIFIYLIALASGTDIKKADYSKIITYSLVVYGCVYWCYFLIIHVLTPAMDWFVSLGL